MIPRDLVNIGSVNRKTVRTIKLVSAIPLSKGTKRFELKICGAYQVETGWMVVTNYTDTFKRSRVMHSVLKLDQSINRLFTTLPMGQGEYINVYLESS